MSIDLDATLAAVTPAIARWKGGIDADDLDLIATAFTADALFQGGRPAPVFGREGVKEYYGSQPNKLTVDFEITHLRSLGATATIAYLDATFHPAEHDDRPSHLTLVFEPIDGDWLICHYHVSPVV